MSSALSHRPVTAGAIRANVARVYDAMLGGKDNYAADRAVTRQLLDIAPDLATIARDNRQWLVRVTRFLVGAVRLDQILDCGTGLPAAENIHETAARLNPDTKVIYVDNDPVVAARGRALLEEGRNAFFADTDLTHPARVFAHPTVATHLDPARPTGLIQAATLHHLPDEFDPTAIMREYVDLLPPGSHVAITHFHRPDDNPALSGLAHRLQDTMLGTMGSGHFRTRDEITAMFAGLELLEPGLVPLADWWPDGPRAKPFLPIQHLILGGVARKR